MKGHVTTKAGRKGWWVVVELDRDPETGKRRRRWQGPFDRKRDADAHLAAAVTRRNEGSFVEPSRQLVRDHLAQWLQGIAPTVRPSTLNCYRMLVETHITPALGNHQLQKLSPAHLNSFYAQLLVDGRRNGRGGLSRRTVRLIHSTVHRALRDAVRQGAIPRNVAQLADPPSPARAEMQSWDADELRTFLAAAAERRLHAAFLLAGLKGMRRAEVLGLRWQDVDLDRGTLAIRQTLITIDYQVSISEPKTSRSRRQLAIEPVIVAALRARRIRQAQEKLAFGPGYVDGDLVFTQPDGSWVHPQHLSETFEREAKAAGLPRIRLHDLRHTFATLSLGAGAPLWAVADCLGHSAVAITDQFYRHAIPAATQQAGALVAGLLYGADGGSR